MIRKLSSKYCAFRASLRIALGAAAAGVCLAATTSLAQSPFPSRTIRIVVPGPPAAPPDILSRVLAAELSQAEGWQVVVENKAGALQTLGALEVLKQPADGHTVFAMSLPAAAATALMSSAGFRLDTDFTSIAKLGVSYNVLALNPSVNAKSVAELVALLKAQPDKLNFSSGGPGTPAHLIGEMFKLQTGVKATHVPYVQVSQAIGDLISGINQYMFITTLPVIDLITTGKLTGLAVTAPKRIAALPNVPTVTEQGFPDLVVEDWVGLAVKNGTPPDVVARLNAAVNKALAKQNVRAAFAKVGAEPAGGSAEDFQKQMSSQVAHWERVIREAGIRM